MFKFDGTTYSLNIYIDIVNSKLIFSKILRKGRLGLRLREDKRTILLVDDEEPQLVLVKTSLEDSGYDILVARNGVEVVEILKKPSAELHLFAGLGWEAFLKY